MRNFKSSKELFDKAWAKVPEALKTMNYEALRSAQEECLKSILAGEDTFVVIPTGGGKTLLAAIPALTLDLPVIVFSPLIALMEDQAQSLNKRGVRAGALNSAQGDVRNALELQAWCEGDTKVLLVAPERITNPQFKAAMAMRKPGMVVLDEAHCLSQWSSNFRPDYVKVGSFIEGINPDIVLAMTATATNTIVEDVRKTLGCEKMTLQRHYTPRLNLHLHSRQCDNVDAVHRQILELVSGDVPPTIIYCATVKHVTELTAYLTERGVECAFYHGQITDGAQKSIQQDSFMSGRVNVIVATNAFGMGIDKPDIRQIIHADMPLSIAAVAQETGRAGRDGGDAECIMFDHPDARNTQEWLWNMSNPNSYTIRFAMQYLRDTADSKNESHVTLKEISDALGDSSGSSAVMYLTSIGAIERQDPSKIASASLLNDNAYLTKQQYAIWQAIKAVGVADEDENYKFTIDAVAKRTGISEASIKTALRSMAKSHAIWYTAPPRSKTSIILRDVTAEELQLADNRRAMEWNQLERVREYVEMPDTNKQDFLTNYFRYIAG